MVSLGTEVIAPFAKSDAEGQPIFQLPGRPANPLPYLGYAPGAYLGRVVDDLLKASPVPAHLDRVYETDMAEGLKAMAVEGHGIAFLPLSAAKREIRQHRLTSAAGQHAEALQVTIDIRAYREKPNAESPRPGKNKSTVNGLWKYLVGPD
jgi:LysR family transcriptional regulator, hypochlorite-specific transcription factor HypT